MKKIISLFLVSLMLLGIFPVLAGANEGETITGDMVSVYNRANAAVGPDGSLYMWGDGRMIADGTNEDRYTPVKIMDDVVSVAIGRTQSNVITSDGTLWVWGTDITSVANDLSPDSDLYYLPLKMMEDVASVYAGENTSAAIKENGDLWIWGRYLYIAAPTSDNKNGIAHTCIPQKIMGDAVSVKLGANHYAALKKDNSLWLWGSNAEKQIAANDDKTFYYSEPIKVLDNVVSYSVSGKNTAAVTADGSLYIWGNNEYYQLGTEDLDACGTPTKVLDNAVSVSIQDTYISAIKKDGSLWDWGLAEFAYNDDGSINGRLPRSTPKKVMDDVVAVYSNYTNDSYNHAAIKKDGSLWTWGYKYVGNGSHILSDTPVKMLEDVAAVYAGNMHTLAVKKDGTLWSWGNADTGCLGLGEGGWNDSNGGFKYQTVPAQIKNFTVDIAPKVIIQLKLNGGTGSDTIKCIPGELISPPDNPEREGYFFAGWYKDEKLTIPWNFDTDVATNDCTLYAKWLPKTTATVIADPANQDVIIDGEKIVFNTYILRDEQGFDVNFVKLRDVAYLLNGTVAQFNVDWRNNAIRLDKKTAYTTQNGAELTVPTVVSAPTKTSITPVLTDGVTAPLEAFRLTDQDGGDHNYFKLRDIGKVAGFQVEWDENRSCIVVTTTKPYSE